MFVYWESGGLLKNIVGEPAEGHEHGSNLRARRHAYWSVRICKYLERIGKFIRSDTLIRDVVEAFTCGVTGSEIR